MKIDYEALHTRAERIHIRSLRIVNGLLTAVLLVLPPALVYCFYEKRGWAAIVAFAVLLISLYGALVFLTGCLCFLCRRLRVAKRVIVLCWLWVPVVNYFVGWYVRGLARQEIDFALYRRQLDDVRVERQICATKYPLLLVHGVGFRDTRYFNYWGRIPRELTKNGAKVYYGNQEAWGTIEYNAGILRSQVLQILQETGCERVNIIAHSKGGLDVRYMIAALHMEDAVASLTTINTPHRGSMLVDFLKRLPDWLYRFICGWIDRGFAAYGDRNPDAYHASYQLSCAFAREFNEKYPDVPGIYYQSYASLMKHGFSSKLLCIPYWLLKWLDAPNDGLVTEASARWADFRGTMTNRRLRGISHGDMIDLTREDYRDFNVREFYVQLVARLRELGF